jgi:hypothetical protein
MYVMRAVLLFLYLGHAKSSAAAGVSLLTSLIMKVWQLFFAAHSFLPESLGMACYDNQSQHPVLLGMPITSLARFVSSGSSFVTGDATVLQWCCHGLWCVCACCDTE